MKNLLNILSASLTLFAAQDLMAGNVSFSVTPAAVSNTYNGTITLQIGGLTNGETVVVEKYFDFKGSGVIQAGDWLGQEFNLTDNQAGMVIGGVTNINVPGDSNPTNGVITATLNFNNGDFAQKIAGNYLFRLSSPTERFTAKTNSFAVTNLPYPQKITGTVSSNGTSTGVANAVVLLLPPGGNGSPVAGTIADASGKYSIPMPVGTYSPLAIKGGFVGDFSTAPVLSLGADATLSSTINITNASSSISGTVVDANTSAPLPGIFVTSQSSTGLIGVNFTDANGDFSISVLPGTIGWGTKVDDTSLQLHGYLGLQNRSSYNAGQSGVSLAVPRANALFYGSVQDSLGNPLPGIDIYANDDNSQYETDGYSDANGNYVAGAIGGINNDFWQVQASQNVSTSYLFTQPGFDQNGGAEISAAQAIAANFIALIGTNTISGKLTGPTGSPLSGIDIYANGTSGTNSYNQNATTGADGSYSMTVAGGTWNIGVSTGTGNGNLPSDEFCPNVSVTVSNANVTVNFQAQAAPYTISGRLLDSIGNPIPDVGLYAYTISTNGNNFNQNATTDNNGNYTMAVVAGTWSVNVNNGGGNSLPSGYLAPPNQTVVISNANATVNFTAILTTLSISGSLKDGNNNPIPGIGIYAYAYIGGTNYNQNTQTGTNGSYSVGVINGDWQVSVSSGGGGNSLPSDYLAPQGQSVVISDSSATVNFVALLATNQICNGPSITATMPAGESGLYYSQYVQVNSCSPNFSNWTLNGTLPSGLQWNSANGQITGTTTDTGTFPFTVGVTDGNNNSTNQTVSLTILAPLYVQTQSVPTGTNGVPYSLQLQAGGGMQPYTNWALAPTSASLPTPLSLSSSGLLSGTPTNSGTFGFTVLVTDSLGAVATQALSLTISASAPQSGALEVTILPQAVATNGAAWKVNNGGSQTSGMVVSGLSVGSNLVSFVPVSGWVTPSNQMVSITNGATNAITVTYTQMPPGFLKVTILPAAAVKAGAQWQVDGGKWLMSGESEPVVTPGNHTVSFSAISGWATPASQVIAITSGSTSTAAGTYLQTGSIEVTITPGGAIASGATWQLDYDGVNHKSGETLTNVPVGSHTVNYNGVDYWTAPAAQMVAINAKTVTKAKGAYTFQGAGIYNGLFMLEVPTPGTSGMLSGLTVTSSGAYTGKLLAGATTNSISGVFNFEGQATNIINRATSQGGPLTLTLDVGFNPPIPNMGGTVSGTGGWTANLLAERATKTTNSAEYTAVLENLTRVFVPVTNELGIVTLLPVPVIPPGYGYFTATNHAGLVKIIGALADGTPFSQSGPLSAGQIPIYGSFNKGTALLIGWLNVDGLGGSLAWIKGTYPASAIYPGGFTNYDITVQYSLWTNPAPHTAALDLPAGVLSLSGGTLVSNLNFNVAVSNNSTLAILADIPTNSLTAKISSTTGLLTVTFGNGQGKSTTKGAGVALQDAGWAGGFFLGKTNAGSILLQAPQQ